MIDPNNFTSVKERHTTEWRSIEPYQNSFGKFDIHFSECDGNSNFSLETIKYLSDFVEHLETYLEDLVDIIFLQYSSIDDYYFNERIEIPEDMEGGPSSIPLAGVEKGLKRIDMNSVISRPRLYFQKEDNEYQGYVIMEVPWDESHGLTLCPTEHGWEIN